MRAFLHGVTGLVRVLVLVGIGSGLLTCALFGERGGDRGSWAWLLEALQPYRHYAMLVGGGILILELLHLLTRPAHRRLPEEMTFKAKGGRIGVRSDAIRDAIARVAEAFECVEEMETVISRHRGNIDLDLKVRVIAGTPIPVLCNDLQKRAREVVSMQIGLFELREVRVHIRDLLRVGKPTPETTYPPASEPPTATPLPATTQDEEEAATPREDSP